MPIGRAPLSRTSPAAATRSNMRHPRVLQLLMDSLRYWVTEMHVDGFRFDLASALARDLHTVDRLSAFFDDAAPRSGGIARQTDRRAVGSRRGRLPGGQLPARLDRVERQVPRHHARVLEGRRRLDRRIRPAPHRLERPVRTAAAAGRTPASTSSPRTTASRCSIWSATSTSTTKPTARATATATTTICRGTTASKGRPMTPAVLDAARAPAAQLHRHAAVVARRADAAGGRRDRAHAAGQQQRLLPGQRVRLARLVARRRRALRCSISRGT